VDKVIFGGAVRVRANSAGNTLRSVPRR